MDTTKGIRLSVASLMTLLGIVYLALTAFPDYLACLKIEVALVVLVGLVYVAIGIGLFMGKHGSTPLYRCEARPDRVPLHSD